jgi:hypothetical protein
MPSATEPDRLWQHYQKPAGKAWPTDRIPVRRFEWSRLVFRLALSTEVKAVASALCLFADADGARVVTTDPRIRHGLNLSDRQVREHVAVLRGLKLLHVVRRGGGRGVTDSMTVCQLTAPADGALPYRLDIDFQPLEQRAKGEAPLKAIEASKAARASRNSGSPASGETAAGSGELRKPGFRSNPETSQAGLPINPANSGSVASGESLPGQPNTVSPASDETTDQAENSGSSASAESPVDNPELRKAASGVSDLDEQNGGSPASEESPKLRKAASKTPEAQFRNSGSPTSDTVFKPENLTTLELSLGGDLTSGEPSDEHPEVAALIHPEPPVDDPALADLGAEPTDPAYDKAREILATVDPAELTGLLSDAQGELEAQLAKGLDDGVQTRADHRQIMIRAAQIVRRAEQLAGGR